MRAGAYHAAAAIVAQHPDGISAAEVGRQLGLEGRTTAVERLRRAAEHGLVRMEGLTNGARWFPGPAIEEAKRLDEQGVPAAPEGEGLSWRRGWLAARKHWEQTGEAP